MHTSNDFFVESYSSFHVFMAIKQLLYRIFLKFKPICQLFPPVKNTLFVLISLLTIIMASLCVLTVKRTKLSKSWLILDYNKQTDESKNKMFIE